MTVFHLKKPTALKLKFSRLMSIHSHVHFLKELIKEQGSQ